MDNYPSNSRTGKAPEEAPEPKKVESVVVGEVTRRKKPLGKRFTETFVGADIGTVAQYVVLEVLIPAAKDMMSDAVSQGIDRMLFGETRGSSRSRSGRPAGTNGYVSYNRMSANKPSRDGLNEFSRRPERRSSHDFDEIILATRAEAEEVIDRLFDLVNQYDQATVADLLDLVGVTSNHVDHKWGWTDIRGAGVTKIRNGYLLDLPKPDSIQ